MQRRNEIKCKIFRFAITLACVLFGILIIYNMDNFKSMMANDIIPYVHDHMSTEREEVKVINTSFRKILGENDEIVDVVLYRFVQDDTNTDLIKGQIGVTSISRSGGDFMKGDVYVQRSNKQAFQEILLNKVHYENITSIRSECEEFFNSDDANFKCERPSRVSIGYKTMITIPISNSDGYTVIGYILLVLNREYDNEKITQVVHDIQPHIPSVQASMSKIN